MIFEVNSSLKTALLFAAAMFASSPLALPTSDDNCPKLSTQTVGPPPGDRSNELDGQPVNPDSPKGKSIGKAIDFIKDVQECFPPGDPNASPPTEKFGGTPTDGPWNPGDQLEDLEMAGKICEDMSLPDSVSGATSGVPDTPDEGELIQDDEIRIFAKNSDGMVIREIPTPASPPFELPAGVALTDLDGFASYGGCDFQSGEFMELVLTLLHELQHLNDEDAEPAGPDSDPCSYEAEVYRAQSDWMCALLDCAADPASEISDDAREMIMDGNAKLCEMIATPNCWLFENCCIETDEACAACMGLTPPFDTRKRSDGPKKTPENTEPGGGDSGGESGPSGGGGTGPVTERRYGFYHLTHTLNDDRYSTVASIEQVSSNVKFLVTDKAYGSRVVLSEDLALFTLPQTEGFFVPVSVQMTSSTEAYIAGYTDLNDQGMILRATLTLDSAVISNSTLSISVQYRGGAFRYPVAIANRRGTAAIYILDRLTSNVIGYHPVADVAYPVARGDDYPGLSGKYAMSVALYKRTGDQFFGGIKLMVTVSNLSSRAPAMRSLGQPTFIISDTDRNGRFDLFEAR